MRTFSLVNCSFNVSSCHDPIGSLAMSCSICWIASSSLSVFNCLLTLSRYCFLLFSAYSWSSLVPLMNFLASLPRLLGGSHSLGVGGKSLVSPGGFEFVRWSPEGGVFIGDVVVFNEVGSPSSPSVPSVCWSFLSDGIVISVGSNHHRRKIKMSPPLRRYSLLKGIWRRGRG
jgi:hypothetical protein